MKQYIPTPWRPSASSRLAGRPARPAPSLPLCPPASPRVRQPAQPRRRRPPALAPRRGWRCGSARLHAAASSQRCPRAATSTGTTVRLKGRGPCQFACVSSIGGVDLNAMKKDPRIRHWWTSRDEKRPEDPLGIPTVLELVRRKSEDSSILPRPPPNSPE